MSQISVLVVDDNETDRYIIKRVLTRSGAVANIEECTDGSKALDFIQTADEFEARLGPHPPRTLVLLDINMPVMSGFEMLQSINDRCANGELDIENSCIVTMLTSSNHSGDREKAMAYDCVADYIEKPLSREKLQIILDRHYPEVE